MVPGWRAIARTHAVTHARTHAPHSTTGWGGTAVALPAVIRTFAHTHATPAAPPAATDRYARTTGGQGAPAPPATATGTLHRGGRGGLATPHHIC